MPGWPLPPGQPAIYPASPAGVTAPDLDDWQFSYQGVTFGAGTALGALKVGGLGALPTINSQDAPFPRDTGEYTGEDAMGGRDITLDFFISQDVFTAMEDFGSAFASSPYLPQPLWFQVPGYEALCSMCRPRLRDGDWDADVAAGNRWEPTVTLHANDPRLYGQGQTATGGDGDTITVSNAGNCEVRPVLLLPRSRAPVLTNTTIGSDAITALTGTIGDDDTVVIDMATPHTAVYWPGGITDPDASLYSVFNWIDRTQTTWWTLVPGDNDVSVSLPSSGDAEAAVWWASAYML